MAVERPWPLEKQFLSRSSVPTRVSCKSAIWPISCTWRRAPRTTRMTMTRKLSTIYAANDPVRIAAQIERGLPVSHLVRFQKQSRLPLGLLAYAIQVPERTLRRRLSQKRLPADESDRLFRFA